MCIALAGIVVNAVSLQKERHPAPLFAPEAATALAPAPASPVPVSQAPAPSPVDAAPKPEAVADPSSKPADRGATVSPPAPRKADPIGDLLRSESAAEHAKTILAAQRALVKLGYDLKVDGSMKPAMIDALHDFEKNHGLPRTDEVTPRLVAKLNGAAH